MPPRPPGLVHFKAAAAAANAIASATVDASHRLGAGAILVITRSGFSARLVSSFSFLIFF